MNGVSLAKAIEGGEFVLLSEYTPPRGVGIERLNACATEIGGLVHAICLPESEDGVRMCSLAACGHLAAAGAEPIAQLITRDMNRIALQAAILGAASMGITNFMCASGRHQALTTSRSARGVFDIDPIQLISVADGMRKAGQLADGQLIDGPPNLVLGTDTNPFSEPMELQVMALEKAVNAGADFVVTQPVFNIDRFNLWMSYVRERGIHEKTCIIASIMPLTDKLEAVAMAEKYSHLDIGDEAVERLNTASDQRRAGIHLAAETLDHVRKVDGVKGACVAAGQDFEAAASVLAASTVARS